MSWQDDLGDMLVGGLRVAGTGLSVALTGAATSVGAALSTGGGDLDHARLGTAAASGALAALIGWLARSPLTPRSVVPPSPSP